MRITPTMERFIQHWGEMGTRWGVNRSVAQVHALLYLSPRPLPADATAEERKKRAIDPALTMLRACVLESQDDAATDPAVKARLAGMLGFLEELTTWYDQMKRRPRTTLERLVRVGAAIVQVLR